MARLSPFHSWSLDIFLWKDKGSRENKVSENRSRSAFGILNPFAFPVVVKPVPSGLHPIYRITLSALRAVFGNASRFGERGENRPQSLTPA